VGKILAGKPAERAGVRVGDLIVSVDGASVEDSGDLIEALSDKDGKTVDLEIVRDKKTMHLKVEIQKVEDDEPGGPRAELLAPAPPEPPAPPSLPECPMPRRPDRNPV
jgi:membrane-associated protease RseP (regulator of RpoE activity)